MSSRMYSLDVLYPPVCTWLSSLEIVRQRYVHGRHKNSNSYYAISWQTLSTFVRRGAASAWRPVKTGADTAATRDLGLLGERRQQVGDPRTTIGLTWCRTARGIKRLKETVLTISPDCSDRPTPDFLAFRISNRGLNRRQRLIKAPMLTLA
jgi:hypothetical protein